MLTIEVDEDGGCFRLLDDDIGMCVSKSRNVLVRIRDALNAVRQTGLVGLTIENHSGSIPNRGGVRPRGVALALVSGPAQLVVRLPDDKLDVWLVNDCKIIAPEPPKRDTPSNEPGLGVNVAVNLLLRWLEDTRLQETTGVDSSENKRLIDDTKKFIKARKRAEPIP